jgi:hypothetical protein
MAAIGPKQTCAGALQMSAFGGKADMTFCPLMTQSGLGTKIAAVRDGSVSGDFGRYSVRTLFPLRADAELYRQRRATGQILALLQFRDGRRP